jgi:hypothetical protein
MTTFASRKILRRRVEPHLGNSYKEGSACSIRVASILTPVGACATASSFKRNACDAALLLRMTAMGRDLPVTEHLSSVAMNVSDGGLRSYARTTSGARRPVGSAFDLTPGVLVFFEGLEPEVSV